ncbi:MAG TPA: SpoIVB peptidase S55 domain-containing protein [Phycisphaerae bacterium]|nr:SpoIVB peptidase S55 domain-containing protein [Phycisphaerae bacterium]
MKTLLCAAVVAASLPAFSLLAHALIPPPPSPSSTAPAADALSPNPDPSRYLFEDQLLPGMKGYGLTVMHGGKIEKFDVEIIDVVRNFSPGNNAILVRCSGLGLEHSGIIAGMSGSPVFIHEKMIGAVAYGWGMSKDPIGGVQPIRQMLAIQTAPQSGAPAAAGGARWGMDGTVARMASGLAGWKALAASLGRDVGRATPTDSNPSALQEGVGLRPLVSPLMVGGGSASTVGMLREELRGTGLMAMESGSGGASGEAGALHPLGGIGLLKPGEIQLEPGSAIAVPLVSGDMDLSAIGTVTEVREGKVYAFGHSFLGEGGTRLPIATSYIYTIMPNVSQSFKMGTSMGTDGTLVTDEQTGIVGLRGKGPATVPIVFHVKNSDGLLDKVYHYQLAPHPRLTPEMLGAILNETLVAQRTLPQQFTARITGDFKFEGKGGETEIAMNNLGASAGFNPMETLLPVAVLVDNPFENLHLKGVTLEASIENEDRSGTIQSVNMDRLTAAPGDEVTALVEVAFFRKGTKRVPIRVRIPAGTPDGDYPLGVGSSSFAMMQEVGYAPQHFDPQDIDGLTSAVKNILGYKTDRLYATLQMNISGTAVGGRELKDLPASRIAMYATDARTDSTPYVSVVRVEAEAGCVVSDGGQMFVVHVDRNADRRYFEPKRAGGGPGAMPPRGPRVQVSSQPASAPSDSGSDGGDGP